MIALFMVFDDEKEKKEKQLYSFIKWTLKREIIYYIIKIKILKIKAKPIYFKLKIIYYYRHFEN